MAGLCFIFGKISVVEQDVSGDRTDIGEDEDEGGKEPFLDVQWLVPGDESPNIESNRCEKHKKTGGIPVENSVVLGSDENEGKPPEKYHNKEQNQEQEGD